MILNISYKNWPNIIYIKYINNDNLKNEKNYMEIITKEIKTLTNNIKEFKEKNEDVKVYLILNINELKKISIDKANENSKFYDNIIKDIRSYISNIYIILKNKSLKLLMKFYINLKYNKDRKKFKYFKTKEDLENYINTKNKNKSPKANQKNNIEKSIKKKK